MSTDCSVDLIFFPLAAQLNYFELNYIDMANYFYLDSEKCFLFSKYTLFSIHVVTTMSDNFAKF